MTKRDPLEKLRHQRKMHAYIIAYVRAGDVLQISIFVIASEISSLHHNIHSANVASFI